uniref:Guanylate cyclase n=1 Tax=Neogobius melanostomus TaxID=47308 RepID=A0A8C6T8Y5_9GOBI
MASTAVNLALSRLRSDARLGYWYDVTLLDESCGYGHAYIGPFNPALCHAASLLVQHWEAGLASPGCLNADCPNLPPLTPPTKVLFTVLRHFGWAHVGILTGTSTSCYLPHVSVVILCMSSLLIGGEHQKELLLAALDMGMISDGYVFIPYDALLYALPFQDVAYPQLTNSTRLRHAYSAILTVTMASDRSFYEAFRQAQIQREIRTSLSATEVSPLFGSVYNMVHYVANAVEERRKATGGRWVKGDTLVLYGGRAGLGLQAQFLVLDSDGDRFVPTHSLDAAHTDGLIGGLKELPHSFIFPGGKPSSAAFCWFSPDYKYLTTLMKYLFQGDFVWLKKIPVGKNMTSVNSSTKSLYSQLREMRHENLNLYIGLFLDCGMFALVMEHCPRGSLADLLADSNMRLDWMFKSSLLIDLIKGMKYLHLRGLSHGRLKSTNCLVDGRFVLKITDYGLPMILRSQGLPIDEDPQGLLWTAPELLRNPIQGGSYAGDIYSFGIIIQEVVTRTLPYAMMDMPAEELLEKLKSPPAGALQCRPVVSVDEAPIECLLLMNECWNEDPHKRPTFDDIFKQFRGINRGKRANIIDSMLRMLEQYSSNLEDLIRERTDELEVERTKTDKLVSQLLPKSVAQSLKKGKKVEPEHYSDSTLYFSDIVGFTTISALSEPIEVVDLLNDLYTMFDAIIASHDVYKVETIGDAYMCASGVPNRNGNRHAAEVANMSLDLLHAIGAFRIKHMPEIKVKIRIGLHSGPLVAGVVGLTMPRYCLFGDTVTTASHMEATGLPYRIHLSLNTVKVLTSLKLGFHFDTRKTEVSVKGSEDTYWLIGRDGFTKPLPVPPDLLGGARNHGISLEEIPIARRQKFLDRQNKQKK